MAQWQNRLDLTDIWHKYSDTEVYDHANEMGNLVAEHLKKITLPEKYRHEQNRLIDAFEFVSDIDEFNETMDDLYDLADTKLDDNWNGKKLMWVATNF
jgi:hypothetical protein